MVQTFLEKYKVFLSGLAAALVLALTEFLSQPVVDWKVVGFAALMAILSYVANQWRGQGVTILGIVGTLAYSFVTLQTSGTFTWQQFILSSVVALLAAVAPPAKSLGYEKTAVIEQAKREGDAISKVIILILCLSIVGGATHAQSFFKALPKKQNAKGLTVSPTGQSTMNAVRPSVNFASFSVPGNRLMTGAGVGYDHLLWNETKQKWDVQWSVNALTWFFVPVSSDPTNGKYAYGVAVGFFNNLVLVGAATDGKYGMATVGIGINLNN